MDIFTAWFIIIIILAIAIYDIWTIWYRGIDTSISRFIRHASERWPIIMPILAFAAGALYGHFFL